MSNLGGHEDSELWRVQIATGEIRTMTLDELDAEFQSGTITEATPVLAPGAMAWTKLADAAGLEGDDSPPEYVPSVAPIAVSLSAPPSASLDALDALDDLDLDSPDAYSFKGKRSGRSKKTGLFIGIGVAVVLVGGLGIAASRAVQSGDFDAKSSLAAEPAKAAAVAPPPAAEDPNPSPPARVLTEEQKARLAEADRARAAKEEQKRRDRPPPPSTRRPQPKSGTPFSNGGSKYDPLNGAL